MQNTNIPKGYQTVMPYLILKGADSFLNFTSKVFGASEKMKHLNEDKTIMHAEIQIGDSTIMFAESGGEWAAQTSGLFIYVQDVDAVHKQALAEGAISMLEPADRDYGRSSGIKDPCGNTWWITSPMP